MLVTYQHREAAGYGPWEAARHFISGSTAPRRFGIAAAASAVGEYGVCFVTNAVPTPILGAPVRSDLIRHKCFLVTVNAEVPTRKPNGEYTRNAATVTPLPLNAPLVNKPLVRIHGGGNAGGGGGGCGTCF